MFQGGLQVIDDLLGENVGIGEIVGVFEAFVSEPEDTQASVVTGDEFFVIIGVVELLFIFEKLFQIFDKRG